MAEPKKVLVLDDDADLLELMGIILKDGGYKTLSLSKGDLINENITSFCPDLILMDVMLAGMDGRIICQTLKANLLYTTPIILISGTHNLAQVMFRVGSPNDFITKPFDIDDFLGKIAHQLIIPVN